MKLERDRSLNSSEPPQVIIAGRSRLRLEIWSVNERVLSRIRPRSQTLDETVNDGMISGAPLIGA